MAPVATRPPGSGARPRSRGRRARAHDRAPVLARLRALPPRVRDAALRHDETGLARGAGAEESAVASFRDAIAVAARQSARSWKLRATTSLARVLAAQGKREEARDALAAIVAWFTEGETARDLVAARE